MTENQPNPTGAEEMDTFPRSYVEELRIENARLRTERNAAREESARLTDIEATAKGFETQLADAQRQAQEASQGCSGSPLPHWTPIMESS